MESALVAAPSRKEWAGLTIASAGALVLLVGLSMGKHLDHDEHQFVASGAVLARHGLLPYRDYGYFHMPNLVFVYAALFRLDDRLLLAARLCSTACGWLTVLTVGGAVYGAFRAAHPDLAAAAACLAGVMLVGSPLFTATSGRAWNHDLPTLLALWSFLSTVAARRASRPGAWAAVGGLLFGLAVGTRLTFAPAGFALLAIVARAGGSPARGWRLVGAFAAAAFVALLPSLYLMAMAPREFVFGNFVYPHLNTAFRQATHYSGAMTWPAKLLYPFTFLLTRLGNIPLSIAFVISTATLALGRGAREHPRRFEAVSLAGLIVGLLAGSFAPTPLFAVYFYATVPFAILLVAYVAADGRTSRAAAAPWLWSLAGLALVTAGIAAPEYRSALQVARSRDWVPVQVHEAGRQLRQRAGPGTILTFSPIIPLEGGLEIYPELATGPFAARAAERISEAQELAYGLFDEDDCLEIVRHRTPAGVLTGYESGMDRPLYRAASDAGFASSSFTCAGLELRLQLRGPEGVAPRR